jgi:hypothetical protein
MSMHNYLVQVTLDEKAALDLASQRGLKMITVDYIRSGHCLTVNVSACVNN